MGEVTEFGTSGLLYRSNKLMYDRSTETLWSHFTGKPVVGPLVDSGIKLEVLPVTVTTWEEWRSKHPDTTVLNIYTGIYSPESYFPEEHPGSIYADYRAEPDAIFPVWIRSGVLPPKSRVVGVSFNAASRAYPQNEILGERVINDTLGGEGIVLLPDQGTGSARVYRRGMHEFSIAGPEALMSERAVLVDNSGNTWVAGTDALTPVSGPQERLARIPADFAYWFGWYQFHQDTDVYAGR